MSDHAGILRMAAYMLLVVVAGLGFWFGARATERVEQTTMRIQDLREQRVADAKHIDRTICLKLNRTNEAVVDLLNLSGSTQLGTRQARALKALEPQDCDNLDSSRPFKR